MLESEFEISSEVWSVTSYGELRREGMECERHNRLNPQSEKSAYVSDCFGDDIPTIAVSDYIAAIPEMIQRWVGGRFTVLGTDGFGRSDTREELRRFFEIDTKSIILAALSTLEREGTLKNRRGEGVIYHKECTCRLRCAAHRGDIDHLEEWIRWALNPDQLCVLLKIRADLGLCNA